MLPTPSESPTASDLPVAANVIGGKTAKTILGRLGPAQRFDPGNCPYQRAASERASGPPVQRLGEPVGIEFTNGDQPGAPFSKGGSSKARGNLRDQNSEQIIILLVL